MGKASQDITARLSRIATEWFPAGTPAWETVYSAIGEIERLRKEAKQKDREIRKSSMVIRRIGDSLSGCAETPK